MLPLPPPTEIDGPIRVAIDAQKAPAHRLPQPSILPEPSFPDMDHRTIEDQTIVQIDRDRIPTPAPTPVPTEIKHDKREEPIEPREEKIQPEPDKKLQRSATFDKLKEEAEQPAKAPRKTWDKKPPTAPRRTKIDEGLASPAPSSPGRESDSEIVIGSKIPRPQVRMHKKS